MKHYVTAIKHSSEAAKSVYVLHHETNEFHHIPRSQIIDGPEYYFEGQSYWIEIKEWLEAKLRWV